MSYPSVLISEVLETMEKGGTNSVLFVEPGTDKLEFCAMKTPTGSLYIAKILVCVDLSTFQTHSPRG